MSAWADHRDRPTRVHQFRCAQCSAQSGLYAYGWRGYRTDDPELDEQPALAFFCPTCSARESEPE